MESIVSRKREIAVLESMYHSKKAEFLAIYGRRRVGKTILIDTFCQSKKGLYFSISGTQHAPLAEQLANFMQRISDVFYSGVALKTVKNWREAFQVLTQAINTVPKNQIILLFFDEFPWLATKNSRLLQYFDYFWNQYWSKNSRIKLTICGSSASWIIDKIIRNKGGLHNRVTCEIHLEAFNLHETRLYLKSRGIKLNNKQIVEIYMLLGGIPYYLSRITKGMSATQITETLAFQQSSFLLEEFNNLYDSLFDGGEIYIELMRSISGSRHGLALKEIIKKCHKLTAGGEAKKKIQALEDAGFIMRFKPYGHSKRGLYYRVIDEYTLFYFRWIEPLKDALKAKSLKRGYWLEMANTPAWYTWSGLAFEAICFKHLTQISNALNLPAAALADSWQYTPTSGNTDDGAQIDLLFDRPDDSITICEIKYSNTPYAIDKQYAKLLQRKLNVFQKKTKTEKTLMLTMVAANGIKQTMYSEEMVSNVVTLEDLFTEE